jgi:hypothetical protein
MMLCNQSPWVMQRQTTLPLAMQPLLLPLLIIMQLQLLHLLPKVWCYYRNVRNVRTRPRWSGLTKNEHAGQNTIWQKQNT